MVFARLLQKEGYEVATAENGFDALLKLKHLLPDVIISDLNMPQMSGFEFLSVVRRRFPQISVVASSGAYGSRVVPTGVLADVFFAKGQDDPETLLKLRKQAQEKGVGPTTLVRMWVMEHLRPAAR